MNPRDVLAMLRIEDGRRWVDAAEDWQLADALAVIDGEEPYHFLTRARGSSKTTDLAAVALALLLPATDARRLYWLGADFGQGTLALDSIAGFLSRSPTLAEQLELQSRRVLVHESRASLDILAADQASAWGLRPDALFVDELAQWSDTPNTQRLWEATSSAVAKLPHARMAVLTTAGSPSHFSRKILDAAYESPLWRVSERRGPAPWTDQARLDEQRKRLPDAVYRQLFENEWAEATGSFFDPALIDAAFTLPGPEIDREDGRTYVAGLDLGHVNDRSAFAIGHREGPKTHLDRLQVWEGSRRRPVNFDEVERFIAAAHDRFRFQLRLDPWQALALSQRLRARGIRCEEFHFGPASKQRLASTLLEGINAGTLRLYEADGLREELLALRLKQAAGGAWSFDHTAKGHDDRAVALALMAVAANERPPGRAISESYLPAGRDREGMLDAGTGLAFPAEDRYFDRSLDGRMALPPGWRRRPTTRRR